jgi:aminopeptidase-like protein
MDSDFLPAAEGIGSEMYALISELYPICRSITGNGFRRTMEIIREHVPIEIREVPAGTRVFDWVVPKEWNIKDAYVKNSNGEKVIDFQKSNLHVVSYSTPVSGKFSFGELKDHLFTIPEHPDWIPYRTSYYKEDWGFCLSHKDYLKLGDGVYQVLIDSTLEDGHLTYGELCLQGDRADEVLLSCHACHPSLCNDNLSGVSLLTFAARTIAALRRRYTYRFLFIPGTIGAITWLCLNQEKVSNIRHGLVVTGVGDPGPVTYKKSRRGAAEIDRTALQVLKNSGRDYKVVDFSPYGYDERQYCSPGFDLPVGRLSRTPYGEYPEYHTSADNLDFVRSEHLEGSFSVLMDILFALENNGAYMSTNPKCEPNLGKRGLYSSYGPEQLAMLWVMNLSDGKNELLDIAERSGMSFRDVLRAASVLFENGLLKGWGTE